MTRLASLPRHLLRASDIVDRKAKEISEWLGSPESSPEYLELQSIRRTLSLVAAQLVFGRVHEAVRELEAVTERLRALAEEGKGKEG